MNSSVIPSLRAAPILAATVLLSACSGPDPGSGSAVVSDSAGVRIVQNPEISFDAAGEEWTLGEEPAVAIGGVAGEGPYLFDRIMGIDRLSDARWVVADMGSSEVRYYDPEGVHLESVGRRGEGPGEFGQILGMRRLAGDTLTIDDSRRRLHLIDEEGRFVGEFTPPGSPIGERTMPAGAFGDGTIVATTTPASPQRLSEPASMEIAYHRATLARPGRDTVPVDVADTIGSWEVTRLIPGWNGMVERVRFEGSTRTALLSDGIVVADPMDFEVRVYSMRGELRTIARADWSPRPVTSDEIETAREDFIAMGGEDGNPVPPQLREQRAEMVEHWEFAPHMPAFSDLIVDREDHLWLREYVPNEPTAGQWIRVPLSPVRWIVMDREGRLAARVSTPARFAPRVIGRDYVAGIYRDAMDVEYVRSYRLTRR